MVVRFIVFVTLFVKISVVGIAMIFPAETGILSFRVLLSPITSCTIVMVSKHTAGCINIRYSFASLLAVIVF